MPRYLDEVHKLDPAVRTQLYRALNEHTFHRMGEPSHIREFHGHVVSAASSSLDGMIESGSFPQDLLSRLSQTDDIHIPSFDARDPAHRRYVIEYGFQHWMSGIQHEDSVSDALLQVKFPGNIRDLRSFIEQLSAYAKRDAYLSDDTKDSVVTIHHFNAVKSQPRWQHLSDVQSTPHVSVHTHTAAATSIATMDEMEAQHILSVLIALKWHKSQTAKVLGIERATLDRKMVRYNLVRPEEK